MKAVNFSRRGMLNPTPFSFVLLLISLAAADPLAATSLFDPKRGEVQQLDPSPAVGAQPVENSSSTMIKLRLDGVMTLGDERRVMIAGPKGERYHFNWRGDIEAPLRFEGELSEKLAGYGLTSIDSRSVWVELPEGTDCKPDLEKGVVACDEGRVQLALTARDTPTPTPPPVTQQTIEGDPRQLSNPFRVNRAQRLRKKSEAQIRAEELKDSYRETNRIQLQEEKERAIKEAPPGFKVSKPLFGASSLVQEKAPPAPPSGPPTAADKVKELKELYRQRNLKLLQQGNTGFLGQGLKQTQ